MGEGPEGNFSSAPSDTVSLAEREREREKEKGREREQKKGGRGVCAPEAEGQRREREKKKVSKEMDKQGSRVCVLDRCIHAYDVQRGVGGEEGGRRERESRKDDRHICYRVAKTHRLP